MPQLTYATVLTPGIAGQIYDISPNTIESKVNAEGSAELAFGWPVRGDTTEQNALKITADTHLAQGIIVHSHAYDVDRQLGTVGIKPKNKVAIMRKGRIWVLSGGAIAMNAPLFFQITTQLFVAAAVMGDTIDLRAQVVCRVPVGGAGLFVVEVDFTNRIP